MQPAVSLRDVVVTLGTYRALTGVSLDVAPGETVALLGASGSGKSTLLRCLAGLQTITSGRLTMFDVEMSPRTAESIRRGMGYVVQEGGLFPHLSVRENLLLAGRGQDDAKNAARIEALLALTRLSPDLLPRFPGELSGGQRQRVAFARGLFREPKLLLLDEPFGALDPVVRSELHEEIVPLLRDGGVTTVLVTHDAAEASLIAQRLVMLERGTIVQDGTAADFTERPASDYVRRYFGGARR